MPWTYLLRCSDGSFYVGSTHDLENRVAQHNAGSVDGYTRRRRPVVLVWAQESERIDEAWALEVKVKGWRREKKLALIEGRYADLSALSTSGSHRSTTPASQPVEAAAPPRRPEPVDRPAPFLAAPTFDRLRAQEPDAGPSTSSGHTG